MQAAVADGISRLRDGQTVTDCDIVSMNDLAAVTWSRDNMVVLLPGLESPFLYSLGENEFRGLQEMLRHVQKVIWVCSIDKAAQQSPQSRMVNGLARVLCTENSNLSFVTSALENHGGVNLWAKRIASVLDDGGSSLKVMREQEYAERNGVMMNNRVVEAQPLNQEIHAKSNSTVPIEEFQKGLPLALTISNPGFLDSLQFIEDSMQYTGLGPDDIIGRI